ncbi:FecR family protein [Chitinophagaceae bacterium LWZ2-11]
MKKSLHYYKSYSVQAFILDADFIAWCKQLPDTDNVYWENFLREYPNQAGKVAEAKSFLQQVHIKDENPTPEQLQRMWNKIQSANAKSKASILHITWMRVAAILILIASAGIVTYYALNRKVTASTEYAEIKTIELSDHSKITLNANSSVEYAKTWDNNHPREVWLKGEAYFEVNHLHKDGTALQPGERFIVHANGMDIEVLGTTFNVLNRHDVANVVLNSGSIQLQFDNKNIEKILLKPGDFVQYAAGSDKPVKKRALPTVVSAWKDKRLAFDNTPFRDVLQMLKDDYGLETVVENQKLLDQPVSGNISSDNEDLVLKGLETLLDIRIERQGNKLIFKK